MVSIYVYGFNTKLNTVSKVWTFEVRCEEISLGNGRFPCRIAALISSGSFKSESPLNSVFVDFPEILRISANVAESSSEA